MTDAKSSLDHVRRLEHAGDYLLAYDTAVQALEAHPDDEALKHRAVLNLAKAGATERAESEFLRLGLDRVSDIEIASLGARIAKDRALQAPASAQAPLLRAAANAYKAVYDRSGSYYPAINAATSNALAGEIDGSRRLAQEVLALCVSQGKDAEESYYLAASEAEAALIVGDVDRAREALVRASSHRDLAARAATRRQLRRLCRALRLPEDVLTPLASPCVARYAGHIIAAPGAHGRFRASDEGMIAERIRAALEGHQVAFGFGALAAGADILFAEALLARGAELHVVLPFSAEDFVASSVLPAKANWTRRFDACLAQATSVTFATDDEYLGHDTLFAYGSLVAMGLAVLRGRYIDAEVRQIAVWDEEQTDAEAGTAFDVQTWRNLGLPEDIISLAGDGVPSPSRGSSDESKAKRELRGMLFGDVKGFSKLAEWQIPLFFEHILGTVGKVLDSFGEAVLYRNTWGDGLYVIMSDGKSAADCALKLQSELAKIDLTAVGLPTTLALRVSAHYGPVFELIDPVLHDRTYSGAQVRRTARIEPVTPPGEVYITEQLAARLALEGDRYACDYVGRIPAAKGYGTLRMYHLRSARAASGLTA